MKNGYSGFLRHKTVWAALLLTLMGCQSTNSDSGSYFNAMSSDDSKNYLTAATNGNLTALTEQFNNVAQLNAKDSKGNSALYNTARRGKLDMVQWLLDEGADVDMLNGKLQETALMGAVYRGRVDVVRALLEAGANPNIVNANKTSALSMALSAKHSDIVSLLVTQGADLDLVIGDQQYSALMTAIDNKDMSSIALLIAAGMDVNAKDP